jgi:hypothetical protein
MTQYNFLTQQDADNFGHEFLDVAQRAAAHAMAPHLQDLQQQLASEQRHRLYSELEAAVPDWRERDRDPRWLRWLSGNDILSGRPRQQLLNDAIARGDTARLVNFFRGFEAEQGSADPYAGDSDYAQAHRARNRARQFGSGQRSFSRQEIANLYERRRRGEIDDATWRRTEAEIVRAGAEGRVIDAIADINGK